MKNKVIFVDRDGTIIKEPPETEQVNSLEELEFMPYVISSLKKLYKNNFKLIIVTNQDNLGTELNPLENFEKINNKIFQILKSENIEIDKIFVCPHTKDDNCNCRKPKLGMVEDWLLNNEFDKENSYVIGDRATDVEFAKNLNIKGFLLNDDNNWEKITDIIINKPRISEIERNTKETSIKLKMNLDGTGEYKISTGLEFFNHMLEQFSKHSSIDMELYCQGDLKVDEHHTIEDCAIAIGEGLKKVLNDKFGIERYGWERILVMDEAQTTVSIDISNRPVFVYDAVFNREYVGDFPTEMTKHFFETLCMYSGINAHISIKGTNTHHMIESCFKAFAKTIKTAIKKTNSQISSTKGVL